MMFYFTEAKFKMQLEKEAILGRCLSKMYNLVGLKSFNEIKPGQYIVLVYFFIPKDIYVKISAKKSLFIRPQERYGFQSIKKIIPSWFPEEAQSWIEIPTKEVQVMRFKSKNPSLGDDFIVWKSNGIVQGYQEYPKTLDYYKKYIKGRKLLFSYANKDGVAKILHATYLQWNMDMSYFVEGKKMSPVYARDHVRKLNDEFFVTAFKEVFFAIVGEASRVKIVKNVFGLMESISEWLKWVERKLKTDSIMPD